MQTATLTITPITVGGVDAVEWNVAVDGWGDTTSQEPDEATAQAAADAWIARFAASQRAVTDLPETSHADVDSDAINANTATTAKRGAAAKTEGPTTAK